MGVFESAIQNRQNINQKIQDNLDEAFKEEELLNKKLTIQDAKTVDNILGSLDYSSSEGDFERARTLNEAWLESANMRETDAGDQKLNQALYDTREGSIAEKERNASEYNKLQTDVDAIWDDLEELKTSDNEFYDFTEIKEVLSDYEAVGEGIIDYNTNWVGKTQYAENIKAINNWIGVGKKLQDIDVDKYDPAVTRQGEDVMSEKKFSAMSSTKGLSMEETKEHLLTVTKNAQGVYRSQGTDERILDSNGIPIDAGETLEQFLQLDSQVKSRMADLKAQGFEVTFGAQAGPFAPGAGTGPLAAGAYSNKYEVIDADGNVSQMMTDNLNNLYAAYSDMSSKYVSELSSPIKTVEGNVTEEEGTPGIQLDDKYANQPIYKTYIEEAYDRWKTGDETAADDSMKKAVSYLGSTIVAQQNLSQAVQANEQKRLSESHIPMIADRERLTKIRVYANNIFAAEQQGKIMPNPPVGLTSDDGATAVLYASGDPKIHNAFAERIIGFVAAEKDDMKGGIMQYDKNISTYLGSGQGALDLDSEYQKLLGDFKLAAGSKKILESDKGRKAYKTRVGSQIEKTFEYLTGKGYGTIDYDSRVKDDVIALNNNEEGSLEWQAALDNIIDVYLPLDTVSGGRVIDSRAKANTISEFGGTDEQEENSFKVFIEFLRAY